MLVISSVVPRQLASTSLTRIGLTGNCIILMKGRIETHEPVTPRVTPQSQDLGEEL